MEKLLYVVAVLLLAAGGIAAAFNIRLIMTSPNVTFATGANLLIFPANLVLQSVIFLSLGLIFRKLNRILKNAGHRRHSEPRPLESSHRERY